MDWTKRINLTVDYIENNLEGEIDDDRIAEIFAGAKGAFQRTFASITGISLSEYIRKRRLTKAGHDIRNTDWRIIDIAVKYGYNSQIAFGYAFKKFHKITPSAARNSNAPLCDFPRLSFKLILSKEGVDSMKFYNSDNAEYIMSRIVCGGESRIQNGAEHMGVKFVCDGYRAAAILPEGADDGGFSQMYYEKNGAAVCIGDFFAVDKGDIFNLTKEQASLFLVELDGMKINSERKYIMMQSDEAKNEKELIVCVDLESMGIVADTPLSENTKALMAFNAEYIRDAFKFALCSDSEKITLCYKGSSSPLILKSGQFRALVMPVVQKRSN